MALCDQLEMQLSQADQQRSQLLEAAGLHAALTPASWIANVLLQLRINLVDIDPNPLILDIARTPAANVPWSVS